MKIDLNRKNSFFLNPGTEEEDGKHVNVDINKVGHVDRKHSDGHKGCLKRDFSFVEIHNTAFVPTSLFFH